MPDDDRPGWWVVVPVKDAAHGKSRLDVPPGLRTRLAVALAADTLGAALAADGVATVLAVTDTDRAAAVARHTGARALVVVPPGLAVALTAGTAAAPPGAPVAVLLGDLPAARPAELAAVLAGVRPGERVFVADADGTGTTLAAARDLPLRPRFGGASATAHRAAGFRDLVAAGGVPRSLRRDVDTLADLDAVSAMLPGTGSRTARLLAEASVRAALSHR